MAMGTTVFRIRIELIFRRCWNLITLSVVQAASRAQVRALFCEYPPKPSAAATQKRSFHTDESEEAMRTNWPAYVAAEMNRIVADEEAFERLVDLFKQAHGRALASDCEAYQWAQEMDDAALTALGFEGRDGFQYNYDLCLMVEYGPRATR
jgi:6-phosphofructokinase